MKILYSLLLVFITGFAKGIPDSKPCSAPESNQFDFWIGSWNLTYNDTSRAVNHITREMDGCVIYERFDDPGQTFKGWSWSVYNTKSKKWEQTWVDNQGGYIPLAGTFENGKMVLSTEPKKNKEGKHEKFQMIFYNIQTSSFDWNWESTVDEGKTWVVKWKIHYERKK